MGRLDDFLNIRLDFLTAFLFFMVVVLSISTCSIKSKVATLETTVANHQDWVEYWGKGIHGNLEDIPKPPLMEGGD